MANYPKTADGRGGNGQTKIYTKRLLIPVTPNEKTQVETLCRILKCSQGELVRKLIAKRWQEHLETGK